MGRQYPPAVVCLVENRATQKYSTVFGLVPFVAPFFSFFWTALYAMLASTMICLGNDFENDVASIYFQKIVVFLYLLLLHLHHPFLHQSSDSLVVD